mgnify:CR=1 FL=1
MEDTKSPWDDMYIKDKYARDRVMKAACLLRQYVKEGDTVLDVGCFTHEARKYFGKFVKYIGIYQKAYHPETRVMDLHHGFEPILCQAALCLETLEHLIDPYDTIESIYKSLPEEGYLVVSLPNEASAFHRIRCLLGIVDGECFSGQGKHLHLPSLTQARQFLHGQYFRILNELYYVSPTAAGSKQAWVGRIISLIPDTIWQLLADRFPSLFARGFIFLLQRKSDLTLQKESIETPFEKSQHKSQGNQTIS